MRPPHHSLLLRAVSCAFLPPFRWGRPTCGATGRHRPFVPAEVPLVVLIETTPQQISRERGATLQICLSVNYKASSVKWHGEAAPATVVAAGLDIGARPGEALWPLPAPRQAQLAVNAGFA